MSRIAMCIVSACVAVLACVGGIVLLRKKISPKCNADMDDTSFDIIDE